MNSRTIALVLLAGMVALAGCSGGPGNGTDTIANSTDAPENTDGDGSEMAAGSSTGTVNFYVSDQPTALDDFRSLNVTISRVGFNRAGTAGNDSTMANESDGGWDEYDINETTVDLTRLVGDNATMLDSIDVPNGTYNKVFAYVSEVNGTLTDGTSQRVKLPSGKLQLNSQFTVAANESVDFVFDIQVKKAGKSGKYVLRPVISESGTDKEITEVDAKVEKHSKGEMSDETDDEDDEMETQTQTETTSTQTTSTQTTSTGNQTTAE